MKALFNEFHDSTATEWKERLVKDLKGVTFDDLSVTDRNGITIQPFYTAEDITNLRPTTEGQADWFICEKIEAGEAATANKQALAALNNGASGIIFKTENNIDLNLLLNGIELPFIYSCFETDDTTTFTEKLNAYFQAKGWDLQTANCFVSHDIIEAKLKGEADNVDALKTPFLTNIEQLGHLCIHANIYQNAGANSVTELGYTLAQLNEYLNWLNNTAGLSKLQKVYLSLSVDTNFYEQIAKLRACRNLVQFLLNQYGLTIPLHLHVETSDLYRSPFDSYSNLLRDTIAGMAGVLGACDSLYIHPFDATIAASNDFSLRMSRNQQLIFKEESYLDKVADTAEGSYYIEKLTEQLSEKAWHIFKETESQGGLLAAYKAGVIKNSIEQQSEALIADYKAGKKVLIGVNKFPNAGDMPTAGTLKEKNKHGIHPVSLTDSLL